MSKSLSSELTRQKSNNQTLFDLEWNRTSHCSCSTVHLTVSNGEAQEGKWFKQRSGGEKGNTVSLQMLSTRVQKYGSVYPSLRPSPVALDNKSTPVICRMTPITWPDVGSCLVSPPRLGTSYSGGEPLCLEILFNPREKGADHREEGRWKQDLFTLTEISSQLRQKGLGGKGSLT